MIHELIKTKEVDFGPILKKSSIVLVSAIGLHLITPKYLNSSPYQTTTALAVVIIVGVLVLTISFDMLINFFKHPWLKYLYYLAIIVILWICVESYPAFTPVDPPFPQLVLTTFLVSALVMCMMVPVGVLAFIVYLFDNDKSRPMQFLNKLPNSEKLDFYRQRGLSEEDILFFRQQMGEAKERV